MVSNVGIDANFMVMDGWLSKKICAGHWLVTWIIVPQLVSLIATFYSEIKYSYTVFPFPRKLFFFEFGLMYCDL